MTVHTKPNQVAPKIIFVIFGLFAYVGAKFFGIDIPLPLIYAAVSIPFMWDAIFRGAATGNGDKIGTDAVQLSGLSYMQGGM